jgi:hypothetical protein
VDLATAPTGNRPGAPIADKEHVAMVRRHLLHVVLVLAVVGTQLIGAAAPSDVAAAQKRLAKQTVLKKGLKWLQSQQDESGAFLNSGGEPDTAATASVISALIALRNVGVEVELDEAVAYVQQTDPSLYESYPGGYASLSVIAVALAGAGGDPHDVDGVDLIARLADSWDADKGIYGTYLIESIVVVTALTLADAPIEDKAIETIVAAQYDDGSWSYDGSTAAGSGDAVTTAFAIQTLVAAEYDGEEVIANAVDYFHTVQAGETVTFGVGAFRPNPDMAPDANTTGLVISALIAAGENPKDGEWGKAVDGLLTFQNENGAFRYNDFQPFDDIATTASALIALAGAPWPVLPVTE